MQRRTLMRTGLVAGVAVAFAPPRRAMSAQTLRLSTQVAAPHPFIDAANVFKDEVEKGSDGALAVKIFPNASLGKDDAVLNELRIGTVDFMISSTNNAAKQIPQLQLFDLYYVFPNYDAFAQAVRPDGPVVTRLRELARERQLGFRLLSIFGSGTRNMAAKTVVTGIDDVEGIRMRVPPSPLIAKSWERFGAVPVTVDWPELYAAIQTGVAEAFESTLSGYNGSKLYEVAPNLALTAHTINGSYLAVSDRSWGRLAAEQQAIVAAAAETAGLAGTKGGQEADRNLVDELKSQHNVQVTEPDKESFIERIAPLHDEFAQSFGAEDLLAMIRARG